MLANRAIGGEKVLRSSQKSSLWSSLVWFGPGERASDYSRPSHTSVLVRETAPPVDREKEPLQTRAPTRRGAAATKGGGGTLSNGPPRPRGVAPSLRNELQIPRIINAKSKQCAALAACRFMNMDQEGRPGWRPAEGIRSRSPSLVCEVLDVGARQTQWFV